MSELSLAEKFEAIEFIDTSHLVFEDDTPVDSFRSEKQQRLLTSVLYSSWCPGVPFLAAANVGLFYALKKNPLVPDVFLSMDISPDSDWWQRQVRAYLFWEFGKSPEVVIEIVSKTPGKELSSKLEDYARIGVDYYVVFDPDQFLGETLLRVYKSQTKKFVETADAWFESVGLGVTLWHGVFEEQEAVWLRWCDREGNVIPTGAERAERERLEKEQQRERAERERERAERAEARSQQLAERLR